MTSNSLRQALGTVFAGVCIGIGGTVNLRVGGLAGAVLFAFGLITVVHYKLGLYTGQAGFFKTKRELARLFYLILIGNVVGCWLMGLLADAATHEAAATLVDGVLAQSPARCFVLAIPCGFIMSTAVAFARKGQYLPLLFGVPVFILCGFRHSIADAYYYAAAGVYTLPVLWTWLAVVAGNFIGCNLHHLFAAKD